MEAIRVNILVIVILCITCIKTGKNLELKFSPKLKESANMKLLENRYAKFITSESSDRVDEYLTPSTTSIISLPNIASDTNLGDQDTTIKAKFYKASKNDSLNETLSSSVLDKINETYSENEFSTKPTQEIAFKFQLVDPILNLVKPIIGELPSASPPALVKKTVEDTTSGSLTTFSTSDATTEIDLIPDDMSSTQSNSTEPITIETSTQNMREYEEKPGDEIICEITLKMGKPYLDWVIPAVLHKPCMCFYCCYIKTCENFKECRKIDLYFCEETLNGLL